MKFAVGSHRVVAMVVVVGLLIQVYLAGLAVFGAASREPHALMGWGLILGTAILLLLALITRRTTRVSGEAAGLLALAILQPVLAFAPRARFPWVSAFHPLVGFAMLALALRMVRRNHGPLAS